MEHGRDVTAASATHAETTSMHVPRPATGPTPPGSRPLHRRLLAAVALAAATIGASAQTAAPKPLRLDGARIDAQLAAAAGTAANDCYAVDTRPGTQLAIDVEATDFTPVIRIARGALCTGVVPTREVHGKTAGPARLAFKSPGGRYLVLIGTADGRGGRYVLSAQAAPPTGNDDGTSPQDDVAAEIPIADRRVALMNKQVQQRREQVAREQAELQRQREAEALRREQQRLAQLQEEAEREARSQATFNAFMGGLNTLGNALAEQNAAYEAQQHALNQAVARGQEMVQAREQAEARRAQQQRAQEQAKRQEGYAALGQQLARANAYRDAQLARETDPVRRAELTRQSQAALDAAAKVGQRDAVLAQTRALNAPGSNNGNPGSGAGTGSASAQARQQAQQQQQAQAEQARQQAEQERQAAARAEQERQLAARAEQQRQQEAQREQFERQRRMSNNGSGSFSTTGLGPVPPGSPGPGSGSQTVNVTHIGGCTASSVTARFNLGVLMGEPTISGSWSWQGEAGCSAPASTRVWLRLQHGTAYGYVAIDPAVPKPGGGFGYNSTGSPDWSQLACGFNGARPGSCMSKDNARSLWANGRVTDVVVAW